MTDQPTNLDDYQERLGRQLVAAAYRKRQQAETGRSGVPRLLILAVVVLVVAVATVGLIAIPLRPAAADVFVITRLEDEVQLAVVDIITDPAEVESQLENELNLTTELRAIPVPPQLEGKIIATGSTGDVSPEVTFDVDSTIEQIILPEGFNGDLLIEYGRKSQSDEPYEATTTDPICSELWARTLAETKTRLAKLAVTVRYETIDTDGFATIDVSASQIDPSYRLIDIAYLATDEVLVTYAGDLDVRPIHPNCN